MDSVTSEKVSEDVYKVSAVIGNLGYLPTHLTDEAINLHTAVEVEVSIDKDVVEGHSVKKIGHLSGYSRTATGAIYGNLTTYASAKAKNKVTWIIKAHQGETVTVSASQEKAGSCTATITL